MPLTLYQSVLRKLIPAEVDANFQYLEILGKSGPGAGYSFTTGVLKVVGGNAINLQVDNTGQQYTEIDICNNGAAKGIIYWDNINKFLTIYPTDSAARTVLGAVGNVLVNATVDNGSGAKLQINGNLSLSSTSSVILHKNGEILAGADVGGFYFAGGGSTSPAIPIFFGGLNTTTVYKKAATHVWMHGGNEKMRLANGNLLLGLASDLPAGMRSLIYGSGTAAPAASGTSQTGILRLGQAYNNNILDFGFYTTGPWIQGANSGSLGSACPITMQPVGGKVFIGTPNDDGSGNTVQVNGGISCTNVAAIYGGVNVSVTSTTNLGIVGCLTNHNLAIYTNGIARLIVPAGGIPVYADNTAAAALATGTVYRTATGQLMVKY